MPITQIQATNAITLGITAAHGENITPIYTSPTVSLGSEVIPGHKLIAFNAFLKNLKAYGHVPSLPDTPLPDFQPEDTDVQRRRKALDIEWTYPRKQLNMFVSSGESGWQPIGSVSLLNPYGYPYRIYSLLDMFTDNLALELGSNSRVGVQIQDVGWGVLDLSDRLTIHGSYTEERFLSYDNPVTNIYVTGSTTGQPVPPAELAFSAGNNSLMGNNDYLGN